MEKYYVGLFLTTQGLMTNNSGSALLLLHKNTQHLSREVYILNKVWKHVTIFTHHKNPTPKVVQETGNSTQSNCSLSIGALVQKSYIHLGVKWQVPAASTIQQHGNKERGLFWCHAVMAIESTCSFHFDPVV